MPNSESAIFVGIAAAAIGEFWEPRDGQQQYGPSELVFFPPRGRIVYYEHTEYYLPGW